MDEAWIQSGPASLPPLSVDSDPPDPPEAAAAGWEVELSVEGGAATVAGVDAGVVVGGVSEGVSPGAWG